LLTHGVRSMIVSNRTYHRACALAESFGGVALCFEEGIRRMAEADIVVCSTAAPHPIIQPEQVREMMTRRGGRSLIFIDIAMPRDVHPDVHCIENVHVYDIDDLQAVVDQHLANRQKEMRAAEAIVEEKTEEFQWWLEAYRNGRDHSLRHYGPLQSARNCEDSVVAGW
jgi:glutamyl-tRNA reductase